MSELLDSLLPVQTVDTDLDFWAAHEVHPDLCRLGQETKVWSLRAFKTCKSRKAEKQRLAFSEHRYTQSNTVQRIHATCLVTFDPSGEMTLEEFIEGAKDHEDIMDMLKNLMDLTPVLEIIVQGQGK